jgi:hypothetical protein
MQWTEEVRERNKHKLRSIQQRKYIFMPSLRLHSKFRHTRTTEYLLPDCMYQKLTPHHVSALFQRSQSRCGAVEQTAFSTSRLIRFLCSLCENWEAVNPTAQFSVFKLTEYVKLRGIMSAL